MGKKLQASTFRPQIELPAAGLTSGIFGSGPVSSHLKRQTKLLIWG